MAVPTRYPSKFLIAALDWRAREELRSIGSID
jgi:hypothetical protein